MPRPSESSRSSAMLSPKRGRTKHIGKKDPPPPKRTRTGASSSQPAAQFDRTKFRNKGKEDRYIILLNWLFVPERQVLLEDGEIPLFTDVLDALNWWILASPADKYDPEVVREFYANAYPVDGDGEELAYRSWVRGKVILFDRDTIHALLHEPSGPADYDWINEVSTRFDDSTITRKQILRLLCIPGTPFSTNSDGQPLRLYRKHMTQLAQLWMMFLVHNVIPNSHVSSLPLPDCYLLYALMSGMKVDVAAIIARDIYKTVVRAGKKGALGFPSLITELCAQRGVDVNRTEKIKPPITLHYVIQNCKEERTPPQNPESHPPPPTTASFHPPSPALPHSEPTPSSSIEDQLRHLSLQNDHLARQNEHLGLQNEMLRQGQSLNVEKKKKKRRRLDPRSIDATVRMSPKREILAQARDPRPSEGTPPKRRTQLYSSPKRESVAWARAGQFQIKVAVPEQMQASFIH
ncbi:unnamed protein product [Lupinus luteus]|uniref:Putative plant transposon protein domain-containing protein n=1 Tax=Lupinus luteus TaxID=3873 RepID=A0AAV1YH47_LUPLU